MNQYHYTYLSTDNARYYIGVRSCKCFPTKDTKYLGSFKDKTFKPVRKIILSYHGSRQDALAYEIYLHNYHNVAVNSGFANKAKQTSVGFNRAGTKTSKATKKKISIALKGKFTGEKHPCFGRTGAKHPMYGKTGEKSPCFGRTGEKHPLYDHTIYLWINKDGTEEFLPMYDLRMKYGLDHGALCGVKSGKRRTHGGWRCSCLIKNNNRKEN